VGPYKNKNVRNQQESDIERDKNEETKTESNKETAITA